jgi:Tfp pilus assembly protein PilN
VRAVNLLPDSGANDGRKVPPLPVLLGCVGLVLISAVLAMTYLSASAGVAKKKQALAQMQAAYAAIPAPAAPPAVATDLPKERQTRLAALASALGQRVAWDRLLREVSQVLPSDVWLLSLNALSPALTSAATAAGGAAPAAPTGFIVTGCTYSQDSVARFLSRLSIVPDLNSMTLGKSIATEPGTGSTGGGGTCPGGMITFTLQGNVRTSGTA